ncbi:MAG: phosphocholine cytidylyltransferase family protein [Pseudomonadota bacterium]
MTNTILLSAGQGRRLAPLTDDRPKCLVSIAGKTILEWQLLALEAAGVEHVTVVTGFKGETIETAIKVISPSIDVRCLNNPFYSVTDNIGSCWIARELFRDDTVLINGDTLFDARVLKRVLADARDPITVTIDSKATYDTDDMKVSTRDGRLLGISKTLEEDVTGESIGMLRFQGEGGARFIDHLTAKLRDPAALKLWYLSIIDELAKEGGVGVVAINGLPWAEIDFPHDIPIAANKVESFDWPVGQDDEAAGKPRNRAI